MHYVERELHALARKLAHLYNKAMTAKLGRKYKPSSRFDGEAVWLRVAAKVQQLKATPEDYITAQFKGSKSRVFANTLHGPIAVKRYYVYFDELNFNSVDDSEKTIAELAEEGKTPSDKKLDMLLNNMNSNLMYSVKTCNPLNPKVINQLLEGACRYHPVVVMLVYGQNEEIRKRYMRTAQGIAEDDPGLIVAANKIGLDTSIFG